VLALTFAGSTTLKSHEVSDYTAIITVVQWRLHAETHPGGEVMSIVAMGVDKFVRVCVCV